MSSLRTTYGGKMTNRTSFAYDLAYCMSAVVWGAAHVLNWGSQNLGSIRAFKS